MGEWAADPMSGKDEREKQVLKTAQENGHVNLGANPMKKIAISRLETQSGKSKDPEPSGLTVVAEGGKSWLYLVSDNGWVARRRLHAGRRWQKQDLDGGDLEGVSTSGNGKLLIGREDGRIIEYKAKVSRGARFLKPTRSSWQLEGIKFGNAGMEAFTFIPKGHYPNEWGTPEHAGGFFLAAVQNMPGVLYVYDLPSGNGDLQKVQRFKEISVAVLPFKVSDLFYSVRQRILYVLFDDRKKGGGKTPFSKLQRMRATDSVFEPVDCKDIPYCGCEGVAEHNGDLYVALDQNDKQKRQNKLKQNYVLKFSQFVF